MAILTNTELAKMRRGLSKDTNPDYKKDDANELFQAIEDWFASVKADAVTAVNSATAPYAFSGTDLKQAFAMWFAVKFEQEKR